MSRWDGVFRCETLGIEDCVVWWDAVAVVVAVIAVFATLFLGYMTLRLGRVANGAAIAAAKASEAAVKLASDEAADRAQNAKDERMMLLLWIAGEMSNSRGRVARLEEKILEGFDKFEKNATRRAHALEVIESLKFPNCEARAGRLHAIGHPTAARLARALAMAKTLSRGADAKMADEKNAKVFFEVLEKSLPKLREDLEVVNNACKAAAVETGIKRTRKSPQEGEQHEDEEGAVAGQGQAEH